VKSGILTTDGDGGEWSIIEGGIGEEGKEGGQPLV